MTIATLPISSGEALSERNYKRFPHFRRVTLTDVRIKPDYSPHPLDLHDKKSFCKLWGQMLKQLIS